MNYCAFLLRMKIKNLIYSLVLPHTTLNNIIYSLVLPHRTVKNANTLDCSFGSFDNIILCTNNNLIR